MNTWVTSLAIGLFSLAGESLPAPVAALTSEHAARLYRIEIYNTYRHDRAEYDRRLAAGEAVWKSFDRAGRPNEQRDEVVAWFTAAREASQRRAALPEVPGLSVTAPAVVAAPTNEEYPVTSGHEENPLVGAVSQEVATKLEIQLPPSAESTEPAQGVVAKQVTTTVRSPDPEVEGTTDPIIIELPTGKRVDVAVEAPEVPAVAPVAPPVKKETPAPVTGAKEQVPTEDPFAVQNLFEPAATPVPATEAATDVDPFSP